MTHFYLCTNPLYQLPEGVISYMYSDKKPRFFATIHSISKGEDFKPVYLKGSHIIFRYIRGDGKHQLFIICLIRHLDRAATSLTLSLRQAAGWYCSCMASRDAPEYGKCSWSLLADFNVLTPGLQVIHYEQADRYVLSFPTGVYTFADHQSMDEFLSEVLEYNDRQLESGNTNIF